MFVSLHVWEGSAVTNCCIQSLEGLFLNRSFEMKEGRREGERENKSLQREEFVH